MKTLIIVLFGLLVLSGIAATVIVTSDTVSAWFMDSSGTVRLNEELWSTNCGLWVADYNGNLYPISTNTPNRFDFFWRMETNGNIVLK